MISRFLDIVVPGRWRRRQIEAIQGIFGLYLDPKRVEELVRKDDTFRNRLFGVRVEAPDAKATSEDLHTRK